MKQPPYQIGKDGFGHLDIKQDVEGWADANTYLPFSYDLVTMNVGKRKLPGWWNGLHWEGRKLKPEDTVSSWKMVHHHE